MIVVDTNVVVSLFVSSPSTSLAKEAAHKDGHWIMPTLWLSEMRSVPVPSQGVLEYAAESGCSAYDCEFVTLAVLAETRLVTLDKRLALRFPRIATPLDRFVGA